MRATDDGEWLQRVPLQRAPDHEPEPWTYLEREDDDGLPAAELEPAPVSRRSFFRRLVGAALGARLAPRLSRWAGFDINRTTFKWWQARPVTGPLNYDALLSATMATYRGSIEDRLKADNTFLTTLRRSGRVVWTNRPDDEFDGLGTS